MSVAQQTARPDYATLRASQPFQWSVGAGQGAYRQVTQTPIRAFNLEPEACIRAFREGRPRIREMFGDEVALAGPATPAVSYGHPNTLGAELIFPEDGEVAHTHLFESCSLDDAIDHLKRPVDFASAGMVPFYLDFRRKMQEAFPDANVVFSFGLEGPMTTAYELRGYSFFTDPHDEPEKMHIFLKLMTDSILDFHRFRCTLTGQPPVSAQGSGMCDDLAAMISPDMFDEFVIPYWDQFFSGMTSGKRSAHVEDLRPQQLKYLETIGLSHFDPSISPKLNPQIIARECRVPFMWRLGSFHYTYMDCQAVRDFVLQAVADGATGVFTHVAEIMCTAVGVEKVRAFIEACKEVEALFAEGRTREEIGARVSPEGQARFWDHWPE